MTKSTVSVDVESNGDTSKQQHMTNSTSLNGKKNKKTIKILCFFTF